MSAAYDYYAILGLDETATDDEVREAYRRAARSNHPDLNPYDPLAAQRFAIVTRAYEVLGDPARRASYRRGATRSAQHPASMAAGAGGNAANTSLATELGLAVGALRIMARRAKLDRRVRRRLRQVARYLERL